MLKVNSYSTKGIKLDQYPLPKFLEEKENLSLLAQTIRVYEDRLHSGLAKVKTRAEVRRTKKKLYRQKGTGGARHGSRSAPIFVGGGKAHGPKGIKRTLQLPAKMKKKAVAISVSTKAKEGLVTVVRGLKNLEKTKDADKLVKKILSDAKTKRATLVLAEKNLGVKKFIKNLKNVKIIFFKDLNAYDVFVGGAIIFDKDIFEEKKTEKEK